MAHFSEIDNNNLVLRTVVVPNSQEHRGQEFLAVDLGLGGNWIQTSYTSRGGKRVHPDTNEVVGDNHFRYNFASPGYLYDSMRDAFIPPKPHAEAVLDETTCLWVIPPEIVVDESIPDDLTE